MSALSILIEEAISDRIAILSERGLNLNGDPYGSDSRLRVQAQFWVAYQGSSYPTGPDFAPRGSEQRYSENRDLEFQHYVEVQDLQRNYLPALQLHEFLMGTIAGFRPDLTEVRGPLRMTSDGIVSAKVEGEVVYRYRASYNILCRWTADPYTGEQGGDTPFIAKQLKYGVWRSPIGQVGEPAPISVKDTEVVLGVVPNGAGN